MNDRNDTQAAAIIADDGAGSVLPARSDATILGAEQWDQVCAGNGLTYRIFVSRPLLPPPPGGYPVVYMVDGNGMFGGAADQAAIRALSGEIRPAVIVGVGYPVSSMFEALGLRNFDLTPPTPPEEVPPQMAGAHVGGADAFLSFILDELAPQIARLHPVDASDQSLFGFSLGGLFVLHTLFNHPQAFRTYVAGSPSIWWNDRAVLEQEPSFSASIRSHAAAPRVLITIGGLEQSADAVAIPPEVLGGSLSHAQIVEQVPIARMVDNAQALAGRLADLPQDGGFVTRFILFDGETHASVISRTISKGIEFALKPQRVEA